MIGLLRRRKSSESPAQLVEGSGGAPADGSPRGCALSKIGAGSRATILGMQCSGVDACRLRALGICEGASVTVVRRSDCSLLEVRGSRVAVGATLASGITVLPAR